MNNADIEQLKERAVRALENDFNMDVSPAKVMGLIHLLEKAEKEVVSLEAKLAEADAMIEELDSDD